MGTLYDLLGALPDDDAEGLRTAFRKAAKATHPDLNPDDPEAALRFRQLVRAHDILSDAEQRAAYDQLLAIALHPPPVKPVYVKLHRFASSTIAATIISSVLIASYTLLGPVSPAPATAENRIKTATRVPAEIAAALSEPEDGTEQPMTTGAVAPARVRGIAIASADPDASFAIKGPHRMPDTLAHRSDLDPALVAFDRAIQHAGFAPGYIDRTMLFYRARNLGRAFAEMRQAKRKANSKPAKTLASTRKPAPPLIIYHHPPAKRERMIAAITP